MKLSEAPSPQPKSYLRSHLLTVAFGLILFGTAAWALGRAFAGHNLAEIQREFLARSNGKLAVALLLTTVSYLIFTGYDLLGVHYLRKALPKARVMQTSFLGFTFANNLGFLGGVGLRLRFYFWLGLSSVDIAKLIAFSSLTYWLGFTVLGGFLFLFYPPQPTPDSWLTPHFIRTLGIVLLALFAIYMLAGHRGWREVRFRHWRFVLPSWKIRLGQIFVSSLDWTLASSVLFVLLPPGLSIGFPSFLAAFLFAQILALASHVPGGLGVFETVLLYVLPEQAHDEGSLLASLLLFRLIYYIAPLIVATLLTGLHEWRRHRHLLADQAADRTALKAKRRALESR